MTSHYFRPDPEARHEERQLTATLRGFSLTFETDASVFSKTRIDFGSELLIDTMQLAPDAVVLDLGCGYGPIGIVAAKLCPEGQVQMVDVNERAVTLARRNLRLNGLTNAEVHLGDGLAPVAGLTFDAILFNPPIRAGKETIYRLVDGAHAALRPGGALWVVIQTKQGAPSMKKKLTDVFGACEDVDRKAGYHILKALR